MSLQLYDEAVLNKFRKWTLETNVTLTGVDETNKLFTTIADQSNDKPIQMPLIALSRPGGFSISSKYKQSKTFSGARFGYTDKNNARLNVIPINIPYRVDIYTRYQYEADEYIRNIVFNIINYPNITVELPYHDLGIEHDSSIRLSSDVEDNSNVPEQLISGQFKRYTIDFVVDDAYLFDIRIKDNLKLIDGDVIDAYDITQKI